MTEVTKDATSTSITSSSIEKPISMETKSTNSTIVQNENENKNEPKTNNANEDDKKDNLKENQTTIKEENINETKEKNVTKESSKESQVNTSESEDAIPKMRIQKAAAAALAAAAAKSKVLATYEEREIRHLVNHLIELQLKKLEMKMNQFDKLEIILDAERKELEKQQSNLYIEHVVLKKQILAMKSEPQSLMSIPNDNTLNNSTTTPSTTTTSGKDKQNDMNIDDNNNTNTSQKKEIITIG